MIVRHVHSVLFPIALLIFYAVVGCIAASVEIDAQGQQQQQHNDDESASSAGRPRPIQATFVNALPTTTVNLYWAGNVNSISEGSLQLYCEFGVLLQRRFSVFTCICFFSQTSD